MYKFYKFRWEETKLGTCSEWGNSTYYIAANPKGEIEKQIEIFDNGRALLYTLNHLDDEYGGLADQPITNEEAAQLTEITEEEFQIISGNTKFTNNS